MDKLRLQKLAGMDTTLEEQLDIALMEMVDTSGMSYKQLIKASEAATRAFKLVEKLKTKFGMKPQEMLKHLDRLHANQRKIMDGIAAMREREAGGGLSGQDQDVLNTTTAGMAPPTDML